LVYFEKMAQNLSDEFQIRLIGVSKKQKKQLEKKYPGKLIAQTRSASVQELAQAYREAAVYVNPTLEDNFPTTNLEALACGTPVVTYRTGGSAEAITDACGIAVRRADYQQLVTATVRAASGMFDPKACRERALEFDKEKRYQEYLNLYQEILTGR
jgi:glycosyltransferase involved in cell wall biosynthesis